MTVDVDVCEPVDLSCAQKSDVDPAGLQPVVEDLDEADDRVGGLGQDSVADRQWQEARLGAEGARLVDQDQVRRVYTAGEVRGGARQADPDKAGRAVRKRACRGHRHHLGRGQAGGGLCPRRPMELRRRRRDPPSSSGTPHGPCRSHPRRRRRRCHGRSTRARRTGAHHQERPRHSRCSRTEARLLEPRPGAIVLPSWSIDYVSVVPGGARPSYAHGYYDRDNAFYVAWDAIGRDREAFLSWMEDHVVAA